jgi:hypothetical protein
MSLTASVWIGTSGYVFRHWRQGVFYPPGLRVRDELAWYADRFRAVELNNPFYKVPSAETFVRWRDATPVDFHLRGQGEPAHQPYPRPARHRRATRRQARRCRDGARWKKRAGRGVRM